MASVRHPIPTLTHRLCRVSERRCPCWNNPSLVKLDHAIPEVEVAVIMRDDYDRLAAPLELRQQLRVEDLLVFWILVCRPLIE